MKVKEVFNYYQMRSVNVGEYADQLAWMMVLIFCAALIGQKLIASFMISGTLSLIYFMLSVIQAFWQTVGTWSVWRRLKPGDIIEKYPSWLGCVSWILFILRVLIIVAAVIYFAKDVWIVVFGR